MLLDPKKLKEKFISSMIEVTDFEYQNGNPFFINLSVPYLIFLKNLSCAYFKGSPDITRIQLPYLEIFHQAFLDGVPLIVLGYDADNDVYVGWNPERIKQRINNKNNVSLYSRISVQEKSTASSSFIEGQLSTGEPFYAFNSSLLPQFFNSIIDLFSEDNKFLDVEKKVVKNVYKQEILFEVTDKIVLTEILPLLKEAKILDTASTCFKHYSRKYPSMSLTDWLNIAKQMHEKLV